MGVCESRPSVSAPAVVARKVSVGASLGAFLLLSVFANENVFAHGGRTAADGCHNDSSTGTRHCHGVKSSPSAARTSGSNKPSTTASSPARAGAGNKPSTARGAATASVSACQNQPYNRQEWNYQGQKFADNIGYYSRQACAAIDADHVVSLRDAHYSGGCAWSPAQKQAFANDLENLVPSCARINRSKGSSLPARFIGLASDGRGVDFEFSRANTCAYLAKYKAVKNKYGLSFSQNNAATFTLLCGISF